MTNQARSRRIPTYRRHKATGQAVVTLDGKDLYLGKYGTPASRDKYARLIAEWVTLGRQAPALLPASRPALTVNDVILAYWQHCLEYYQDAPVEREKIKLPLRPLRQLYGRSEAAAFGPLSLKAVRGEMCKTLVYLQNYESGAACQAGLSSYLTFYCEERPHQSLEYRTPAAVYWEATRQRGKSPGKQQRVLLARQ